MYHEKNFGDWLENQYLNGDIAVTEERWLAKEGVLEDGFKWIVQCYTAPLDAYDFLTIDFMQEGDNGNRIIDLMGLLTGDRDVAQIQREFMRWHIDRYFSDRIDDFRQRDKERHRVQDDAA